MRELTNAIKWAEPKSKVKISLNKHYLKVIINVENVGVGITIEEDNERFRIYENGFHGDLTNQMPSSRTGIGLSVVNPNLLMDDDSKIRFSKTQKGIENETDKNIYITQFRIEIPEKIFEVVDRLKV